MGTVPILHLFLALRISILPEIAELGNIACMGSELVLQAADVVILNPMLEPDDVKMECGRALQMCTSLLFIGAMKTASSKSSAKCDVLSPILVARTDRHRRGPTALASPRCGCNQSASGARSPRPTLATVVRIMNCCGCFAS